jgi:hypothetical protein
MMERLEGWIVERGERALSGVLMVLMLVIGLGAFSLVASLLTGCGSSAVHDHARAALVVARTVETAGGVVDAARSEALDRVEREHPTDPEHDAALEAEAARWRPVGASFDLLRTSILGWVDAIELAHLADSDDVSLETLVPIARRVIELYARAAAMLRELGVDAPPLPPLLSLIGGVS